jgi:hypothetical protein
MKRYGLITTRKFGSAVVIDRTVLGDDNHKLAASQLPDVSCIMLYALEMQLILSDLNPES